jgi:hypothetical protein
MMKTIALMLVALLFVGCTDESSRVTSEAEPEAPVTRDELIALRAGVPFAPEQYLARRETYRLFGVELGDGTLPKTAIVADTKTWSTRIWKEGDLVGRGLRVVAIADGRVDLVDARGATLSLARGKDISLRVARHELDVVAAPLGKHRLRIDSAAARAALEGHGAGATAEKVDLFGGPALKLGPLEPGGLFAEAGFREGDLLLAYDGSPVTDGTLDELAAALTREGAIPRVRVFRAGASIDLTFVR